MIVRNIPEEEFNYTYQTLPAKGESWVVETRTGPGEGVDSEAYPEIAQALQEHNSTERMEEKPSEWDSYMSKGYYIGGCI